MNKDGIELLFRVFNDPLAQSIHPDGIYLFAQTEANTESVLKAVADDTSCDILILQTAPRSGYAGYEKWVQALEQQGIASSRIKGVPMDDTVLLNTRTESQALMHYVAHQGYKTIAVAAAPFHQLRAFMTSVTILREKRLKLQVVSRPGASSPWLTEVVHSQGTLKATRSELIHAEMERIEIYQDKGDLASYRQVLAYLDKRDALYL